MLFRELFVDNFVLYIVLQLLLYSGLCAAYAPGRVVDAWLGDGVVVPPAQYGALRRGEGGVATVLGAGAATAHEAVAHRGSALTCIEGKVYHYFFTYLT